METRKNILARLLLAVGIIQILFIIAQVFGFVEMEKYVMFGPILAMITIILLIALIGLCVQFYFSRKNK